MVKLKEGDFSQSCNCGWATEKSGDYSAKCPKCGSRVKTERVEKAAKKAAVKKAEPKKVAEKKAPAKKKAPKKAK